MVRVCKRPCHDCPFRRDIPAWQHTSQAWHNATRVTPYSLQMCHHSVPREEGGSGTNATRTICGGNVVFARKQGAGVLPGVAVTGEDVVFDTPEEMIGAAAGTWEEGRRRFLEAQLPHVRTRLLKSSTPT